MCVLGVNPAFLPDWEYPKGKSPPSLFLFLAHSSSALKTRDQRKGRGTTSPQGLRRPFGAQHPYS